MGLWSRVVDAAKNCCGRVFSKKKDSEVEFPYDHGLISLHDSAKREGLRDIFNVSMKLKIDGKKEKPIPYFNGLGKIIEDVYGIPIAKEMFVSDSIIVEDVISDEITTRR